MFDLHLLQNLPRIWAYCPLLCSAPISFCNFDQLILQGAVYELVVVPLSVEKDAGCWQKLPVQLVHLNATTPHPHSFLLDAHTVLPEISVQIRFPDVDRDAVPLLLLEWAGSLWGPTSLLPKTTPYLILNPTLFHHPPAPTAIDWHKQANYNDMFTLYIDP